ncbi:MAG: hypothetical protein D6738_14480 [Acidobacteria bacterium]|nr:MAG: hypothetical protein D6738_14480 [Acidobacteriota bacterium]
MHENPRELAAISREHLESAVRVDTQSDENSNTIPSTEGQKVLAEQLAEFFAALGGTIERDEHANVIASFAGRGAGADKRPVALMVHLDTSKGTRAVERLNLLEKWDGTRVPYPENPALHVDVETYPATREYLGHDLLFGPGTAPVGLDDKLGLAHMMTLARILAEHREIDCPPLVMIGRPDEEIGRMAAVEGLAQLLADRGVAFGYTIDGILPYEVNVENFNAAQASLTFPDPPLGEFPSAAQRVVVRIGGVNTHGCTAREEGYRAATRLTAEILERLDREQLVPRHVVPIAFASDEGREADAEVTFLADASGRKALEHAVGAVVQPHTRRGASWKLLRDEPFDGPAPGAAALAMLRFVQQFIASKPGFVLLAEDSDGYEGYSNPYRALPVDGGLRLDVRLRDFTDDGLTARKRHVGEMAQQAGAECVIVDQYVNMGPRMAEHGYLVDLARVAGDSVGVTVRRRPIRGGTGVDPFLDRGVPIANLGTGYFALESEKEFTSMQFLAGHARWLTALVEAIARHET